MVRLPSGEVMQSVAGTNELLAQHFGALTCFRVWRSIGTHVFFEFGMPKIVRVRPKTRPAFSVLEGELSIGIHADDWCLTGSNVATVRGATVTNAEVKVIKNYVYGLRLPVFSMSDEGVFSCQFGSTVSVEIDQNAVVDDTSDLEDEVTIYSPTFKRSFNFMRGFY